MASKKQIRTNILVLLFVLVLLTIFISFLATHFTGESGVKSDKGIVFCQPENAPIERQKCFFTAHWHFHFDMNVCGQKKILLFETGDLQKLHTHVEKNKVHWHGVLPADQKTKNITDFSDLKLSNVFKQLNIPITSNSIYNFKSGGTCPDGKTATLKVFVNNEQKKDFMDYILKDKDKIAIEFG